MTHILPPTNAKRWDALQYYQRTKLAIKFGYRTAHNVRQRGLEYCAYKYLSRTDQEVVRNILNGVYIDAAKGKVMG